MLARSLWGAGALCLGLANGAAQAQTTVTVPTAPPSGSPTAPPPGTVAVPMGAPAYAPLGVPAPPAAAAPVFVRASVPAPANVELNRFFYYPYYYYPHNYWPTQGPKWPEPAGAPYMRPPAYMAYPPFKEPNWRYEAWEPQRYYRGFHFWLDQF